MLSNGSRSAWSLAVTSFSCLWNITSGDQGMCIFSMCVWLSPEALNLVFHWLSEPMWGSRVRDSLAVVWFRPGLSACSGFSHLALRSVSVCWQVLCAVVRTRDSLVRKRCEEILFQRPPNCTRGKVWRPRAK